MSRFVSVGLSIYAVVVIVAIAVVVPLTIIYLHDNSIVPGIRMYFKFYEDFGSRFVDRTGILSRDDVASAVFVRAIKPYSNSGLDEEAVYIGRILRDGVYGYIHILYENISRNAIRWTNFLKKNNLDPEKHEVGLIVSIVIYNKTSREIIYHYVDAISYRPAKILDRNTMHIYRIDIVKRNGRAYTKNVIYEERRKIVLEPTVYTQPPPEEPPKNLWCATVTTTPPGLCWYRRAWISVENLTNILPPDYFITVNDVKYMRIPTIIMENFNSQSYVGAWMSKELQNMYIGFHITINVGDIIQILAKGLKIDIPFKISTGFSWGGEQYTYSTGLGLHPFNHRWTWLWGRTVVVFYTVYDTYADNTCCISYCFIKQYGYTCSWETVQDPVLGSATMCLCKKPLEDEVYGYISSVYVVDGIIQGGSADGRSDDRIMYLFYSGSNLSYFGSLQSYNSVPFSKIFQTYDVCGADFEFGVSGATIATAASLIAKPLGLTTYAAIKALEKYLASISISFSVQGAKIYTDGYIDNHGPASIDIYIAVSSIRYTSPDGTCMFKAPIGLEIRVY